MACTTKTCPSPTVEELVADARVKEAAYLLLLEKLEARWGTPAEQPNDAHAIHLLAHALLSIACVTSFVPARPHAKASRP